MLRRAVPNGNSIVIALDLQPVPVDGCCFFQFVVDSDGSALAARDYQQRTDRVDDNPGVVSVGILRPLSHLGLARAYGVTGDKDKSLAQYREFLALWKNADPDLRILDEAKNEYAKLSNSIR